MRYYLLAALSVLLRQDMALVGRSGPPGAAGRAWRSSELEVLQPGSRLNGTKMHAYGQIVERLSAKRMGYRAADDIPYGCGWNAPKNFTQGRTINAWANETFPDSKLVTTWEIPFANQREKTLYPADFRSFGRDVIDGWREYFTTYGKQTQFTRFND